MGNFYLQIFGTTKENQIYNSQFPWSIFIKKCRTQNNHIKNPQKYNNSQQMCPIQCPFPFISSFSHSRIKSPPFAILSMRPNLCPIPVPFFSNNFPRRHNMNISPWAALDQIKCGQKIIAFYKYWPLTFVPYSLIN